METIPVTTIPVSQKSQSPEIRFTDQTQSAEPPEQMTEFQRGAAKLGKKWAELNLAGDAILLEDARAVLHQNRQFQYPHSVEDLDSIHRKDDMTQQEEMKIGDTTTINHNYPPPQASQSAQTPDPSQAPPRTDSKPNKIWEVAKVMVPPLAAAGLAVGAMKMMEKPSSDHVNKPVLTLVDTDNIDE